MFFGKSTSTFSVHNEKWKTPKDFLEPQFYPDPGLFRASLEKLTKDDDELLKNLASHKATIRVLAPYLKIMRKEKMKIVENTMRKRSGKPQHERILVEKKSKEQIFLSTVPDLSEKDELLFSIHQTGDVLKTLLDAKHVASYLVDPLRLELYQNPSVSPSSTPRPPCKIELETTMAAYAAYTNQYVWSSNVENDQRFPQGIGVSGTMLRHALCVPLKTSDDKVVAVYEFARDASQNSFSAGEIQLALALAGWMGVAIMQNALYASAAKKQELTNYLSQLTEHYHSEKVNTDNIFSDFVVFAREVIGAEQSNLFLVDKKTNERVELEQYEQGLEDTRHLYKRETRRTIDNDGSTLSKVVFNQEVVDWQINDTDFCEIENSGIRSLLYAPVVSLKETKGVIELINKKGDIVFSKDDKDILLTFADFLAINFHHLRVQEQLKNTQLKLKVMNELLFYHMKPCSHDQEAIKNYSHELPEEFFTLTWFPSPSDEKLKLVEYTINMFHEVLGDSFMVLNNVPKFVLTVQNCYRPNPYHNFLHAFGVTHTMANIISRYHNIFTGIERKSLMVASLCHDVDHRGYNNNFIQLTRHYLASLYEDSPLENHHYAVTKIILQQCGMFKYIKADIYNEILEEIYNAIIATDLSLYFQCRMELLQIADEKTFTFKNPYHRRLVKSLMMTACDLSGQTKALPICQRITEDVYEEFYQQGDVEKKMGYVPLPTMDRNKKSMIAENQVQFLSVVVLPCVETVSRIFSTLSPMVWDSKLLLKQWKELAEVKEANT